VSKTSAPWVIKLGGSLSSSGDLIPWLSALAETRAIIVPGGGPFADAVRASQNTLGFDDGLAHTLAIRAMGVYGQLLIGLEPRLSGVSSIDALRSIDAPPTAKVWLPDPEEAALSGLKPTWDLTSDSMAAHLAITLGLPRLLLIKSIDHDGPSTSALLDAVTRGIVDPEMPHCVKGKSLEIWQAGPSSRKGLGEALANPVSCFRRLEISGA
jgi:5-(aminomethyl)-3-furanmethanol phosphate kinase